MSGGTISAIRQTPIQVWTGALFGVLDGARTALGTTEYDSFVWIATERIGIEAARLAVGEAMRATREAADEDAA